MSDKPVAFRHWMIDEEFPDDSCWEYFDAPTGEDCKECQPLYDRPFKELTDEEIKTVLDSIKFEEMVTADDLFYMFARAILRKAQS